MDKRLLKKNLMSLGNSSSGFRQWDDCGCQGRCNDGNASLWLITTSPLTFWYRFSSPETSMEMIPKRVPGTIHNLSSMWNQKKVSRVELVWWRIAITSKSVAIHSNSYYTILEPVFFSSELVWGTLKASPEPVSLLWVLNSNKDAKYLSSLDNKALNP